MTRIDTVREWVEGYALSRCAAPPREETWGWVMDVGWSQHVTRYVLPEPDEKLVRGLAEAHPVPGVLVWACAPPETVTHWLPAGRRLRDPVWLMETRLGEVTSTESPAGYEVRSWWRGGVVTVLVVSTMDGGFAARGQAGLPDGGRTAVMDWVETAPEHRRRGLGRLVMNTLTAAVRQRDAERGVLAASAEGRALYTELGWSVVTPLTCVYHPADDASAS